MVVFTQPQSKILQKLVDDLAQLFITELELSLDSIEYRSGGILARCGRSIQGCHGRELRKGVSGGEMYRGRRLGLGGNIALVSIREKVYDISRGTFTWSPAVPRSWPSSLGVAHRRTRTSAALGRTPPGVGPFPSRNLTPRLALSILESMATYDCAWVNEWAVVEHIARGSSSLTCLRSVGHAYFEHLQSPIANALPTYLRLVTGSSHSDSLSSSSRGLISGI
jgi:hypothetical protein